MASYFHVSTDYLLKGKDHDKVDSRTKLLDVVTQLTESAKACKSVRDPIFQYHQLEMIKSFS